MTHAELLSAFVTRLSYEDMPEPLREQLRIRLLDATGCALGALAEETPRLLREHTDELGGAGLSTLIGGGRTAPDRAAFYNGALVRYLDFNDSYLAPGETCHPSDNLAPVLAAAEYAGRSGRDFMAALAVAYQVQCRLSDVAPVRHRGFDHTTQGAYAVAAGVSKALGLDQRRTAHAIAISGAAFNALRVSRTGALSHWKGLAYPNTAFGGTHAALLAMRGVTGPLEVFEGNKGFMESIAGRFEIDWPREDLGRIGRTILKKYDAEIHSQSAIEGILELRREHAFQPAEVEGVEVDIFEVAYNIIGGGEEGDKRIVRNKEEADHSLPYLIAAALLDGTVMPEQYRPERIRREDVQELLQRVVVRPNEEMSGRFPGEMPCRVRVRLRSGEMFRKEKRDYEGFHTRPMSWKAALDKFERLAEPHVKLGLRSEIADAISRLESIPVAEFTRLLAAVGEAGAKHA